MEQCLIDNKICNEQNRKCKECKLKNCRSTIKMIEEEQKYIDRDNLRKLKNSLPDNCKQCKMLEIIDLKKQIVKCFYRMKDKCLIEKM